MFLYWTNCWRTAARHWHCTTQHWPYTWKKVLILIRKEHWQSHQIHHLTCRTQVSFHLHTIIFASNRFLWQRIISHLKKCLLASGTRKAAGWQRGACSRWSCFSPQEQNYALQEKIMGNMTTLRQICSHQSCSTCLKPTQERTEAESNRMYFQGKNQFQHYNLKFKLSLNFHKNQTW